MSPSGAVRILRHGTTRRRAEAILQHGPDPNFVEPGEVALRRRGGFSAASVDGPFPNGTPEEYAAGKARNFPDEGGPAIVEMEVPEEIAALADVGDEYRFEPGYGLEELIQAWPRIVKRVV